MDLTALITEFLGSVGGGQIEIYNEFSFQHELGIFLREHPKCKGFKVQFERNISYFEISLEEMVKKEIDIVIFNDEKSEKYAIELKYPKNGQHPEQMYAFVRDVKFAEQLREREFTKTATVVLVDAPLFYEGRKTDGIYKYFRNLHSIHGVIPKPTGNSSEKIKIKGRYDFEWIQLYGDTKFYVIEI